MDLFLVVTHLTAAVGGVLIGSWLHAAAADRTLRGR
jgi:hypothetical protein